MNQRQFVDQLKNISPSKSGLIAAGYEDNEADAARNSFFCQRREKPLSMETYDDDMLDCLKEWNLAGVEIGPLTFSSVPVGTSESIEIGLVESDPLIFNIKTRCYLLMDHEKKGRVLCDVARDGASLMSALLVLARFLAKNMVNQSDINDDSATHLTKEECVEKLGGVRYESFCTSILGC